MKDYRRKLLKDLKMWAWIIAIVPATYIICVFCIWIFGIQSLLHVTIVAGATSMFVVALIWWIWALRAITRLLRHWDATQLAVNEILVEVQTVRSSIKEVFNEPNDK